MKFVRSSFSSDTPPCSVETIIPDTVLTEDETKEASGTSPRSLAAEASSSSPSTPPSPTVSEIDYKTQNDSHGKACIAKISGQVRHIFRDCGNLKCAKIVVTVGKNDRHDLPWCDTCLKRLSRSVLAADRARR